MPLGLPVRVVPGAKRDGVERTADGAIKIRLRARAIDGAANASLQEFLAAALDVAPRTVLIKVGAHSRNKVIQVEGWNAEQIGARLLGDSP